MRDSNFINYLKTLPSEDWSRMVTSRWSVKDVVAHMVGWEKGDAEVIREAWELKIKPWWLLTDNYDEFNAKSVEFYKDYTPEELIAEWQMWQDKVREEVERVGEENLRSHPDLFAWVFEGVDDDRRDGTLSHYKHHYSQIKRTLGRDGRKGLR